MNDITLNKTIEKTESLLSDKQKNGTIRSLAEETNFLSGAMQVIHLVYGENKNRLDSVPPKWIFSGMGGNSINGYNYK